MFGLFRSRPVVRRIGPAQAGDCASLHAESFAYAWSQTDLEALLAERNCLAHGARLRPGGPLQGFILSRVAADEAEILTVAVAAKARRAGLGGRLLAANLAALGGAGVKTLFLEVDAGNAAARALYAAFGFTEAGRRAAYYRTTGGDRSPALVLRRDL